MNGIDQEIMDKYDNLGIIGEGSYGVVIKCKHKQSGQVSTSSLISVTQSASAHQDRPSNKEFSLGLDCPNVCVKG